MSTGTPHSPSSNGSNVSSDAGPSPEGRWPWDVATIALAAALAQVVASIVLGMARLERFTAAANEPAAPYLVVAALVAIAGLSVWVVRERVAVAAPLAVALPIAIWSAMRGRTTGLGLAYHGEFILHHFSALLGLVVAIMLPLAWARDSRLGRARMVPAIVAIPGALMLAAAHLGEVPFGPELFAHRQLATVGAALLLAAWPVSAALFWSKLGPAHRRLLAFILLVPLIVRIGVVGWPGLSGELVAQTHIVWVGAAIVVTAFVTLSLLRPRVDLWVMILVGVICLLGAMLVYVLYEFRFGELEDDLGGLLQSLFGFVIPYPSYVSGPRAAMMMMGLFFAFLTVYSALVSREDRVRGVALGLMLIAGIGFSSPHLVLMLGVGALLFVETLLPGAPYRELEPTGASRYRGELAAVERELNVAGDASPGADLDTLREVLTALAERLELEPPTEAVIGSAQVKLGLRGEVDGPILDVRALLGPTVTRVELTVGLPGREEPVFELVPDPGKRGKRPTHLVARSHRVHGELRALEEFGDAPLDALSSFPTAYVRAWYGGVEVDLGRELSSLRVDPLDALVRALVRALSRPEN